MVPNLLPIGMLLGFMGLVDIPMDLATVLVASLALGLCVDDTIHFLHHFDLHNQILINTVLLIFCQKNFFLFHGAVLPRKPDGLNRRSNGVGASADQSNVTVSRLTPDQRHANPARPVGPAWRQVRATQPRPGRCRPAAGSSAPTAERESDPPSRRR